MPRYTLKIFETYEGLKPVLRERHYLFFGDDVSAVAEAIRHYDLLVKNVDRLSGFVLHKGFRVLYERARRTEALGSGYEVQPASPQPSPATPAQSGARTRSEPHRPSSTRLEACDAASRAAG
jgi:hypothetical protein